MKKIATLLITLITVLAILLNNPVISWAMTVNGPAGQQSNGWFKDSFQVFIAHGTTTCSGPGTAFPYTYTSTNPGKHTYAFYADSADNPYLSIDGSGMTPLDMRCPPLSTTPTLVKQFSASIDAQAPYVNITSPPGSANTTASSYTISGLAGDPEGNLTEVKPVINGSTGSGVPTTGGTFSVDIPLSNGSNTVQMIAYDSVGHSATSNTVVITRSGSTGGPSTGGSTGSSGSTPSSSGNSSASSAPAPTTAASPTSGGTSMPQAVKFNQQQVLNILDPHDANNNETDVQATAALSGATGKTYGLLIATIIILFVLCAVIVWRFRPIFAELDRDKSGLRRRIISIVTIPSLLPLLGLGFIGYQQLSSNVKNSLSSQLEKAAQTSALKLDREFNQRRVIITKTASDILQIKSQYQQQSNQLSQQKDQCSATVKSAIPRGQYSQVTGSDNCLPFLTGFAQLVGSSASNVSNYSAALDQGAAQAQKDLTAQENQRVDELLGSLRHYFPDMLELDVVDSAGNTQAVLPRTDSKQPPTTQSHKNLSASASSESLALFDNTTKIRQLILTYPISSGNQHLGGAVATFDTDNKYFIPSIWSSTPKPYNTDQVYFITTAGELITPHSIGQTAYQQLRPLSHTPASKVYELKLASQTLATRTSPVANTNWVVAVGAPANSILAPLAGIQRTAILAITGFLLLSALLGIWFVSKIAGEIERLFRGATVFAQGNLDYRIGLKSHDELQVLGDTMDKMAADIKAAQEALVEKDKEFINIATHELKAPMTSIIGNLSMITDGTGQVDDAARKLIDQAYQGTVRLRDIVTDMLDIARLESGHAEFKPESLNIHDIAQAVVDMQMVPAKQASLTLIYQPADNLPLVMADKNKLQIILTNFVSNAIKYNRSGGTITVAHSVDDGKLITSVADTGLGIPEDQQSHMFEKFYRVQHDDRANVPGTGLGLHITKRFIEAMGGQVWFNSIHGQGTTFYFSLPLSAQPTDQSATELGS